MTIVDLVAAVFAARALLDLWFDEDSFLIELRARTQESQRWFWRKLLNCRFCLSHWAPQVTVVLLFLASWLLPEPWSVVVKLPIYGLAATGLIRLFDEHRPEKLDESSGASTIPKDSDDGREPTTDVR